MTVINKIWGNLFFRNVIILISRTGLAQIVGLLATLLLARLYLPADFGVFLAFLSLVSLLSVTGQYDFALVTVKTQKAANKLFSVTLWCALFLFVIYGALVLIFDHSLLRLLDTPQLKGWIVVAPVAACLIGLNSLLSNYASFVRNFKLVGSARIIQSLSVGVFSIILGIFFSGVAGLIMGSLIGALCSLVYLLYFQKSRQPLAFLTDRAAVLSTAKEYREFPIYNGLTYLFDTLIVVMPAFFIIASYDDKEAGYYAFFVRVIMTPISMISGAIAQVYLKELSDRINQQRGPLGYFVKLSGLLAILAAPPFVVLYLYAPELFAFIFGDEWRVAGQYVQILVPALFIRFIASTLSSTLHATRHSRLLASWRIIAFATTFLVLSKYAGLVAIEELLYFLVLCDCLLYILYHMFSCYSIMRFRIS